MLGEKKSRQSWKLYQKWGVVEALLGSGMGVTQYCEHRKASGETLDFQRVDDI